MNFLVIRNLIEKHRLIFAISFSIILSLALTVLSIVLYNITGTSKLDLSRPGYEAAIKQLKKPESTDNSFSSDNSLNTDIMKKYLKNYQQQVDDLNGYGNFSEKVFEVSRLGLGVPLPAAPTASEQE